MGKSTLSSYTVATSMKQQNLLHVCTEHRSKPERRIYCRLDLHVYHIGDDNVSKTNFGSVDRIHQFHV